MHHEWAAPTITLPQPPPLHLQPQQERKTLHITNVHVFAAQGVQKDQAIELNDQCKTSPCPITGTQVWGGMATSSHLIPGATVPYTPYHSPTIRLFRADNHVSQKYTSLFLPCLAASAKHWGSSLNECICASHKFLKEKGMQIFHFHSSRLWPQCNLCGCVVSSKGFQVCSDLACEINRRVKGLGFVLKYCWKASQWFPWLNKRGDLLYCSSLASRMISVQLLWDEKFRFLLQQSNNQLL